jgi:hypothetical protein
MGMASTAETQYVIQKSFCCCEGIRTLPIADSVGANVWVKQKEGEKGEYEGD